MKGSPAGRLKDDWISTEATVTACKQRLLGREILSNEGYIPPEYIVTFSYSVESQTYEGTYRTNSPQECGYAFEISYDPNRPSRNTGADVLNNPWIRFAAAALGVLAVLIAIWVWGKEGWFQ